MKYYLGLDNGGTTTKAALFDMQGRQIAVAGMSTASITPKPGFVERDMEEMWQANCTVTREAIEKAGLDPRDIAGLGICGHGKGLYLWGQGRPPRAPRHHLHRQPGLGLSAALGRGRHGGESLRALLPACDGLSARGAAGLAQGQ